MNTPRQLFWFNTLFAFLIFSSGCTSTHLRPIDVEIQRDGTGLTKKSGQKINGYDLLDGTHADYNGWARLTGQDSLSFWKSKYIPESNIDDEGIIDATQEKIRTSGPVIAIAAIKYLEVVESSPGKTVLAVIAAPFVLVITIVGISMIAADSGNLY